jgi:hypothetical protein
VIVVGGLESGTARVEIPGRVVAVGDPAAGGELVEEHLVPHLLFFGRCLAIAGLAVPREFQSEGDELASLPELRRLVCRAGLKLLYFLLAQELGEGTHRRD